MNKDCAEFEPLMASYVDGEAAADERAAVDAHLKACAPCRDGVAAERAARDVLQARRADLCGRAPAHLHARCADQARHIERPPAQVVPMPVRPRSPFTRRLPLAAAATILLAVGGVFALGLNNKVQALAFQMTIDHVKCARFSTPATGADSKVAGDGWAQRFGWPLTVPPSSAPAGLELRGVRRCGVTDGRVAHVMYRWNGEPLSLYVLPSKAISGDAVVERFGHDSVMWTQNGRTYVVLAESSTRPDLDKVVRYMRTAAH